MPRLPDSRERVKRRRHTVGDPAWHSGASRRRTDVRRKADVVTVCVARAAQHIDEAFAVVVHPMNSAGCPRQKRWFVAVSKHRSRIAHWPQSDVTQNGVLLSSPIAVPGSDTGRLLGLLDRKVGDRNGSCRQADVRRSTCILRIGGTASHFCGTTWVTSLRRSAGLAQNEIASATPCPRESEGMTRISNVDGDDASNLIRGFECATSMPHPASAPSPEKIPPNAR